MSRIKIFYLTTSPQIAGAEKMLYELVTRLDKSKFESVVWVLKSEKDGLLLEHLRKQGIEAHTVDMTSKWQIHKLVHLYKNIKTFKPDILQSYLFFDNIIGRVLGRLAGVPIIVSGQRNVDIQQGVIRKWIDRRTSPLTDYVISNTKAGMNLTIKNLGLAKERVYAISNGVEADKVNSHKLDISHLIGKKIPNDTFIVGSISFMIEQKGLSDLIKAAKEVFKTHPHVKFVLIGDGPIKNNLEKSIQDLKDKIFLVGHKENAADYIPLFDCLVLPSLWEGMPNVVMEAMAQNIPVVATNVGGVPELIEDGKNGFIVKSGDINSLVNGLKKMIRLSPTERQVMGKHGLEHLRTNFTFEKMVSSYENLYTDFYAKKRT